jgi:hypothetical protein
MKYFEWVPFLLRLTITIFWSENPIGGNCDDQRDKSLHGAGDGFETALSFFGIGQPLDEHT